MFSSFQIHFFLSLAINSLRERQKRIDTVVSCFRFERNDSKTKFIGNLIDSVHFANRRRMITLDVFDFRIKTC